MSRGPGALLLLVLAGSGSATSPGEYLFHAAGCYGCHTTEDGLPLAGGRAFETPYGTFYSPNISPDRETGIGNWSRDAFVRALKHGSAPDGGAYFPVFPYTSYRLMTDADAGAIFDYLQTREPHGKPNRAHDLPWWLARWMMQPWQWWVLEEPSTQPPEQAKEPKLARGRYLVDALAHCGECHTPRRFAGLTDHSRYLSGTSDGPDGDKVPNITPHRETGIGKWSADDLAYFLDTGALPNGDYTGGSMSEVIDNTTARLTPEDREAIVHYLRSVAALEGP